MFPPDWIMTGEDGDANFFISLYQCDIFQLQKQLSNLLLVRGWAITLFSAILGFAIAEKNSLLSLMGIFPIFFLYLLESVYDKYRLLYSTRIRDIEKKIFNKKLKTFAKNLADNYPIVDRDNKNLPYNEREAFMKALLLPSRVILYFILLFLLVVASFWMN